MNIVKLQSNVDVLINFDNIDVISVKGKELSIWFNGDSREASIYECCVSLDSVLEQIHSGDRTVRVLV